MSLDFSSQEFIDDFLVEADEHLQSINENLLALESLAQETGPDKVITRDELLVELLRSYHTLKGLSGMIGLTPASQISHKLEDLLKKVQRTELDFSPDLFDGLLSGSRALQDWVETLRDPNHAAPDVEAVLQNLDEVANSGASQNTDLLDGFDFPEAEETPPASHPPESPPASPPDAPPQTPQPDKAAPSRPPVFLPRAIDKALQPNERLHLKQAYKTKKPVYLITFQPSREKSDRGENVNALRQQIEQGGKIIKALPEIRNGKVCFHFLAAFDTAPDPHEFIPAEWKPIHPGQAPAKKREKSLFAEHEHLSLRVDLDRLNEIMQLTGKLVVIRSRLREHTATLAKSAHKTRLEDTLSDLERTLRDLREAVMHTRMVPIGEIFARVPLIVRDISRSTGKQVSLNIIGQNTEIDKLLSERLADPILHLIRNALTHGIEEPAVRQAHGKNPTGTLTLRGETRGDNIVIYIEDDGAGINLEAIRQKAQEQGLLPPDKTSLSMDEALQLICRPGFSTRDQADMGAGRGVGMDVVYQAINSVGGTLSMQSQPGQGTTFILRLPITLAIIDAFLIRSGGQIFAIPKSSIARIIEVPTSDITRLENQWLLKEGQGNYLRLHDLNAMFHLPDSQEIRRYGLTSLAHDQRDVLLCDQVLDLTEIVVLPIRDPLISVPGLLGAAELGDGTLVLIYDPDRLFDAAVLSQ